MSRLNPHYLHHHTGLEAVVSPPLDLVTAVAWHPQREELLAGTRDGCLVSVDPLMGTREIACDLPEAGALSISPDGTQVALLGRAAPLEIRGLPDGDLQVQVDMQFVGDLWVGWWRGGVAVAGQGLDRRQVVVLDHAGRRRASGELPPGVVVGVDAKGHLMLGRVSSRGARILPLGRGRFDTMPPTSHRLRFGPGGRLIGVAEGGVTIWDQGSGPVTVKTYGVSAAALTPSGQALAIGTRDGGVALVAVGGGALERARPGQTGGHDQAVRVLAFSQRGRWLASVGERIWLWSW
ncbi:MAG: hypothetical protein GXP62_11545 [Oligoflexia bacterium]|nr:hypothetical protein [Oligoflexia bacterium]